MRFVIDVVGVGGTGSWLINPLVKFLGSIGEFKLELYDNDEVEPKNIIRQNFLPRDVSLMKPRVMRRYATNNVVISTNGNYDRYNSPNNIVIGCVDKIKPRFDIVKTMLINKGPDDNVIYIDSGNEQLYGQINLIVKYGEKLIIPKPFVELLKQEESETSHISCANMQEQTVSINFKQAAEILMMLTNVSRYTSDGLADITRIDFDKLVKDIERGIFKSTIFTSFVDSYESEIEVINLEDFYMKKTSDFIYDFTHNGFVDSSCNTLGCYINEVIAHNS